MARKKGCAFCGSRHHTTNIRRGQFRSYLLCEKCSTAQEKFVWVPDSAIDPEETVPSIGKVIWNKVEKIIPKKFRKKS